MFLKKKQENFEKQENLLHDFILFFDEKKITFYFQN